MLLYGKTDVLVLIIGKSVKKVAKLRGGGSAFAGFGLLKVLIKIYSENVIDLPQGGIDMERTENDDDKIVVELLESVTELLPSIALGQFFPRRQRRYG